MENSVKNDAVKKSGDTEESKMLSDPIKQAGEEIMAGEQSVGFKPEKTLPAESINERLKEHQISADDWNKQDMFKKLHTWTERFISEFKLEITEPAIMVDSLRRTRYGHYRHGRNGFGLRDEIAINGAFISKEGFWKTLGTLLHELLHAEQERTGKPGKYNYHNKAFQKHAASFGLIVDSKGYTQYAPAPSPFWNILDKYNVAAPDIPASAQIPAKPGKSKLKLWMCECDRPVRVPVPSRTGPAEETYQYDHPGRGT